jgi:hypothetical protein
MVYTAMCTSALYTQDAAHGVQGYVTTTYYSDAICASSPVSSQSQAIGLCEAGTDATSLNLIAASSRKIAYIIESPLTLSSNSTTTQRSLAISSVNYQDSSCTAVAVIATDSDGQPFTGERVENKRLAVAKLRGDVPSVAPAAAPAATNTPLPTTEALLHGIWQRLAPQLPLTLHPAKEPKLAFVWLLAAFSSDTPTKGDTDSRRPWPPRPWPTPRPPKGASAMDPAPPTPDADPPEPPDPPDPPDPPAASDALRSAATSDAGPDAGSGDADAVAYGGGADAEELGAFFAANALPAVVPFSQKTVQKIFAGAIKTHFLLFAAPGAPEVAGFRAVAAEGSGKMLFVTVAPEEEGPSPPRRAARAPRVCHTRRPCQGVSS